MTTRTIAALTTALALLAGPAFADVKGVKVTKLGSRFFSGSLTRMNDPWGREVFWIGGGDVTWTTDPGTDHAAVKDGFISVTPLHMDLTNYRLMEAVGSWALDL